MNKADRKAIFRLRSAIILEDVRHLLQFVT